MPLKLQAANCNKQHAATLDPNETDPHHVSSSDVSVTERIQSINQVQEEVKMEV